MIRGGSYVHRPPTLVLEVQMPMSSRVLAPGEARALGVKTYFVVSEETLFEIMDRARQGEDNDEIFDSMHPKEIQPIEDQGSGGVW
jgi:hypothetical protein